VNYEYTQKDVNKIQDALQKKMDEVIHSFEENLKKGGTKAKAVNDFSFSSGYNSKQEKS
jgi:predicted transcriptional regulator